MAGKGNKGSKSTGPRVFVGNLPFDMDWKALKDLFRDTGVAVLHADIHQDTRTGKSKGNALVEVVDENEVLQAIDRLNGVELDGRRLLVREDRDAGKGEAKGSGPSRPPWEKARQPIRPAPSANVITERRYGLPSWSQPKPQPEPEAMGDGVLFVENLPARCTWQRVKDLFRDAGFQPKMKGVNVNDENGTAVVELEDPGQAYEAVEALQDAKLDGQQLLISEGVVPGDGDEPPPAPAQVLRRPPREERRVLGGGARVPLQTPAQPVKPQPTPLVQNKGGGKRAAVASQPGTVEEKQVRRLFAENLPPDTDWKKLKDLFQEYVVVAYADVVDVGDDEGYGILEFETRTDALEACMQFNGVLLDGRPVRLRQDRGEFADLKSRAGKKRKRKDAAPGGAVRPRPTAAPEVEEEEADALLEPEGEALPEEMQDEELDLDEGAGPTKKKPRRGSRGRNGDDDGERKPLGPQVFVKNLDFKIVWQELKDHMRQAGDVRFCKVLNNADGRPKGCALVEYMNEEACEEAIALLNGTMLGARAIDVVREDGRAGARL